MGWWPAAEKGGVVGDEPADVLGAALNAAVETRAQRSGAPPTLPEVLADLSAAVGRRLRATLADGEVVEAAGAPNPVAVEALAAALAEIERIYELDWQRAPSPGELLETAAFVLAPGLDGLAVPAQVRRITA